MKIAFRDEILNCKQMVTTPGRIHPGDLMELPEGLLIVETVQPGCPIWESNREFFCAVLVQTESGTKIPIRNLPSSVAILRPKK